MFLRCLSSPHRSKLGLDKEPGMIHLETSISDRRESSSHLGHQIQGFYYWEARDPLHTQETSSICETAFTGCKIAETLPITIVFQTDRRELNTK